MKTDYNAQAFDSTQKQRHANKLASHLIYGQKQLKVVVLLCVLAVIIIFCASYAVKYFLSSAGMQPTATQTSNQFASLASQHQVTFYI